MGFEELDSCPKFMPILLFFQKPTYDFVEILVPTLNPLVKCKYTVKVSFQFTEEITDTVEGFTKRELKKILWFAAKESYFVFNSLLFK